MADASPAAVLDRTELAWAAGFFDGEGSTIVVPAVLIRFQKAVGGLCRIVGPEGRDMYKCVSSGRLEAMAIVALLWSQLGEIKRCQANKAIKTFVVQYEHADFAARVGRHAGRVFEVIGLSIEHEADLQRLEIAWAAGFMDGEGCFGIARAGKRVNGWVSEGDNNVEKVLRLLEPFLGEIKRDEAHRALAAFRAQVRLKGSTTHCRRGHEYTHTALRGGRTRRICNPCARIIDRRKRARLGIPPRAFKDLSRRYTQ